LPAEGVAFDRSQQDAVPVSNEPQILNFLENRLSESSLVRRFAEGRTAPARMWRASGSAVPETTRVLVVKTWHQEGWERHFTVRLEHVVSGG
jgi:hypothetical protein